MGLPHVRGEASAGAVPGTAFGQGRDSERGTPFGKPLSGILQFAPDGQTVKAFLLLKLHRPQPHKRGPDKAEAEDGGDDRDFHFRFPPDLLAKTAG